MILNIPTSDDFEKLANSCLVQAFNILFETDKHITDNYSKSLKEAVWNYSQEKLNTIIVLIHQGIEAFMKASICRTSALLLIESKRTDWPVLPKQRDKEFNDFYSISAESLLHTFFATTSAKVDERLIKHIEEIRKVRNQVVHGLSKHQFSAEFLLEKILDTYLFFKEKHYWWVAVNNSYFHHPLTGYHDLQAEKAQFADRLEYVLDTLGKNKFSKHLSVNTKGRSYYCPICTRNYESETGVDYRFKVAYLSPNTALSEELICLNCLQPSVIERSPCPYEDCNGNVMYRVDKEYGLCLTCKQDVYWTGNDDEVDNANDDSDGAE